MTLFHQALALIVVLIWGTNFVFIRIGLDELEPFTFASLRFILVVFPLVFFFPKPQVSWRSLISYGVFIGFGQFGLLFWAMQENVTPGLASLIIQMQVFFTIFLAVLLANERITGTQLFALCLCFIGFLLIILFTDGTTTSVGIVVVLIAALSWSCGNLVVKNAGKVNVLAYIAWSSIFALPPLVLMAVINQPMEQIGASVLQASWKTWSVIVWQSVGNTMIGYGLWNFLLNRYPASSVAPWALLVPVFGMSASALMLGEVMPWWKLAAMGLIIAGLAINIWGARRRS
ncbi:MAG: O-acetylserine/cysteine efflux transporter [Cryomorphaceae bacterium]|jgi:O-acetylserine/cysteine efflux transporter